MKVLIVAKTRRGPGACVGAIAADGRSVRLVAADADVNERAGLEYEVGEVWEIEPASDPNIIPPHVENVIVRSARKLRRTSKLEQTIRRFMPPMLGGPEKLFDGCAQATPAGGLYVAERTGIPRHSTMFWVPDRPLQLDCEGKRIRYRYPTEDGGRTLTFVGFQEPLPEIPSGTLLRVSLAHWWRPKERAGEELRCFVQLSGWFLAPGTQALDSASPSRAQTPQKGVEPTSVERANQPGNVLPRALAMMKQTFGFADFLPVQAEVISRILHRQDTLVVMPTGGGKSLCYQLPALLFDGLTVVVSPLVALMQDQVRQLREVGVSAAGLNHMVAHSEYMTIMDRVRRGGTKILYLAPETLLRPETLLLLEQSNLACLAVDEAHCISEWGHDFRPEYRQLQPVRRRFPHAVCAALTATATARVRDDIRRSLGIPSAGEFVASFNRPNLFLGVEARRDGLAQILVFLERHRAESGIIYCGTRKQADELAAALTANGWPALPYHAGLDDDARRRNQDRFINDDAPLIVATIAFGMGINKSNVRFVIHAHLPKDLESYYQEIGRAGRDGLPAHCLLLYSRGDAMVHRHFIQEGAPSEQAGRKARLNALLRFAEARGCRRQPLLAYFSEPFGQPCGHCDNCVPAPSGAVTRDATAAAHKFLSCVQHTGQVFGPDHIILVLRGSRAERVLARRHDRLSAYGVGTEHSAAEWRELARQFIQLGLVEQEPEFGGLRLTSKAGDVLQGKEKILVSLEPLLGSAAPSAAPVHHDPGLLERLRQLRRQLADRAQVPAYVIFSDRALLEMATFFPQDQARFLAINGVGQTKLAHYGEQFLQVIRAWCVPRGLAAKPARETIGPTALIRPASRRRFDDIGECFVAGETIGNIADRYNILPATVLQHLHKFHQAGGQLDAQRLLSQSRLSESDRARVLSAFERLGLERLAPVHQALSGTIPYDELHLLRLYLACRERARSRSGCETPSHAQG